MEETINLSAIRFVVTEKHTEPVPQHQRLPDFSDTAKGAAKHKKDDKIALQSVADARSLVPYDGAVF